MSTLTQGLLNLQEIYDLLKALDRRQPLTKVDLVAFFRANKKCKIIDSHNTLSIVVLFKDAGIKCALKLECGQNSTTAHELQWYQRYSLPGVEKSFIGGDVLEYFAYIIMKDFSNFESIADAVFGGRLPSRSVYEEVEAVLEADLQLFNSTKQYSAPTEQYRSACKKFAARADEASYYPFLRTLIESETININNRSYLSPQKILKDISSTQALIDRLFTSDIGVIHGDLHVGNVLQHKTSEGKLLILDPGSVNLLPFCYDGGKILQSIHSGYEQIIRGLYVLEYTDEGAYDLAVSSVAVLDTAYAHIHHTWHKTLLLGSLFMEAMHFLTMAPHHANKRNEAIALYLTGVQRLNELFDTLKSK